ncbi:MAG TPA: carbon monoxide dehydrogenase subunit G [Burkholderiaceae bacterium]|nr:carbon monoxide dehydrogenase subunit G [Burkholderiaceae bacterium]
MNLEGERRLPAAIDQAWAALNDPAVLKACITGCESLELTGDNEYTAVMAVRIGPVNAKFKGRLRLLNVQPPNAYTIEFDGQGGVAGFGKGAADVALTADGSETVLRYTAKAQVGGKIAQIGSRLVDSAAEKVSGEFFTAFEKYLLDLRAATEAAAAAPAAMPAEAAAAVAPAEGLAGTGAAAEAVSGAASAAPAPPPRPAVVVPLPTRAPAPAGIPWGWVAVGAVVGAVITWLFIR